MSQESWEPPKLSELLLWGGVLEVSWLLPARNMSWGVEFERGEQKMQQLMKDLLCSLPSSLCQLGNEGAVSTKREL